MLILVRPGARRRRALDGRFAWILEAAGLLFLTALAAALRIYRLDEIPFGMRGDEGYVGLAVRYIHELGYIGPFIHENAGYPLGPVYFYARLIDWFGVSIFNLRLGAALLGIVTVPVAYLAFRQAATPRVAFAAAFLLAVSHWHIALSRVAYPVIGWPLMEVVSVGFLAAGMRTRQWYYYFCAGVAAMFCWYAYQAALLFPLGLAVFFVARMITAINVSRPREVLLWGILALAALLAAMPMIRYFQEPEHDYNRHQDLVAITNTQEYKDADSLIEKARFYYDREIDYYRSLAWESIPEQATGIGVEPPVDALTMALIIGGAGIAVWRWRNPVYLLALVMVPVMSLGSVLTIGEVYRRSFGIVPFLSLLGGLAFGVLWERTDALAPRRRFAALAALAVMAAAIAYANINLHFDTYANAPVNRNIFWPGITFAAEEIHGLPDDTYLYFYSDIAPRDQEIMRFFMGRHVGTRGEERSRKFAEHTWTIDKRVGSVAFVFLDRYINDVPHVAVRYPGGQVLEKQDEYGLLYRVYYLQPGTAIPPEYAGAPPVTVALSPRGDTELPPVETTVFQRECGVTNVPVDYLVHRYRPDVDTYAIFATTSVRGGGDVMAVWLEDGSLANGGCIGTGAFALEGFAEDVTEIGVEAEAGQTYYVGVAVDAASATGLVMREVPR